MRSASQALVSIVLPVYNGSRYIDDSIRSCLAQSWKDFELIIVDDASTDDTPLKLARYASEDSRVRVIRHEANRKLPAALNTGFDAARGKYLTWTSDDNRYHPDAIEAMLGFLQEHRDIDLVYADYTEIDSENRPVRSIRVTDPEDLVHRNCIGGCLLYRREVYEKVGAYSESLFLAEDYDYWLRVSKRFRLAPLHRDLYCYRRHAESLSARNQDRVARIVSGILARHIPDLPWLSAPQKAHCFIRMAAAKKKSRQWVSSANHMFRAICLSPRTACGHLFNRRHRDRNDRIVSGQC